MKANYTHIVLVLDKSGSMASVRKDTVGSVSNFIKDQKDVPGEATFQMVQFDSTVAPGEIMDIKMVRDFTMHDYNPGGGTALFDAIGKAINDTGEFLKSKPENDKPSRVIVVIVTDGEENSSREFGLEKIKSMITHQQDVYKWNFVFLGANIDAFSVSATLGISAQATSNYAHNSVGTQSVFCSTSANIAALRCSTDLNKSYAFTKEQQEQNEKGA